MKKRNKPLSEKELLEDLDEHRAHADALAQLLPGEYRADDPLSFIFAYRVFDLRDRFPAPLPTFRQALACLFTEQAYLPELSAEIVAYLRDGRAITIPPAFFIRQQARFNHREAAAAWVEARLNAIKTGSGFAKASGITIANPNDPFEKQVSDALAAQDSCLINPSEIDQVCEQVKQWLRDEVRSGSAGPSSL